MNLFDLTGKNAMIVGGAGGLGKLVAQAFAEAGAQVAIASRTEEKLKAACEELKAATGKGKVTIKWSNKAYADGYVIYRSIAKTKGFKKVITTSSSKSSFVNKKGLKAGKRYYYKVRGYVEINGKKVYTKYSSTVSAVVK